MLMQVFNHSRRLSIKESEELHLDHNYFYIYSKMIFQVILLYFAALHGSSRAVQVRQPQPYSFGYAIKDKEGVQHRQEAGDGLGTVKGNYGFIDNKGIRRQVDYLADHAGFRAQIKTNEPGTTGRNPAAVKMISNDPYAHGAGVPYNSRVNVPFVPALYESNGVSGFPTVRNFHAYTLDHADNMVHGRGNMDVLVRSNMLGSGYTQQPGIVYYGGNLIGGRITGHDSRFSTM